MGASLQGYDELRESERSFQLYDIMIRWRDPCEIHGEPIAKRERVFVLQRKVGFDSGRVHVIDKNDKRMKKPGFNTAEQSALAQRSPWA